MELKITNESILSVRKVNSIINEYDCIVASGDFFINEDKICGFSFKNNKAHLYADSNDYARIMAPINRDLKALIGNNPFANDQENYHNYIRIISQAFFTIEKLHEKRDEFKKILETKINSNQPLLTLESRLKQESMIESLFYVLPMNLIKNDKNNPIDYNYSLCQDIQLLFPYVDINAIKSNFELKENQILVTIDSDGVINSLV